MTQQTTKAKKTTQEAPVVWMLCVLFLLIMGCSEAFDPFNRVTDLRILAIRAEPPDLLTNEQARIDALVVHSENPDVSFRWSWCPLSAGAARDHECLVSQEDMDRLLSSPGLTNAFPPLDLGIDPTAIFGWSVEPSTMRQLCEIAFATIIPDFVPPVSCAEKFPILLRLDVSDGNRTVSAVKQLPLLLNDSLERNANPEFGPVEMTDVDGNPITVQDDAFEVQRGRSVEVTVGIPQTAAELFLPPATGDRPNPSVRRETLVMTWFVTGGTTRFQRTGFIDGETPFADLRKNRWTPAFTGKDSETLYVVLQDERGGVSYMAIQAKEAQTP